MSNWLSTLNSIIDNFIGIYGNLIDKAANANILNENRSESPDELKQRVWISAWITAFLVIHVS